MKHEKPRIKVKPFVRLPTTAYRKMLADRNAMREELTCLRDAVSAFREMRRETQAELKRVKRALAIFENDLAERSKFRSRPAKGKRK